MEHEFIQELTTQKEHRTFSWCYGHISRIMGSVGYSNLSLLRLFHLTSQTSRDVGSKLAAILIIGLFSRNMASSSHTLLNNWSFMCHY